MNAIMVGGLMHGRRVRVTDCRSLRFPVPQDARISPDWKHEEYVATAAVDDDGTRLFATPRLAQEFRNQPHALFRLL